MGVVLVVILIRRKQASRNSIITSEQHEMNVTENESKTTKTIKKQNSKEADYLNSDIVVSENAKRGNSDYQSTNNIVFANAQQPPQTGSQKQQYQSIEYANMSEAQKVQYANINNSQFSQQQTIKSQYANSDQISNSRTNQYANSDQISNSSANQYANANQIDSTKLTQYANLNQ